MSNSIFSFINDNKELLEKILAEPTGDVLIPPDDFEFGHQDLIHDIEDQKDDVVFTIAIGAFTLYTKIPIADLADNIQFLKNIKDPDIRQSLIEFLETDSLPDAETDVDDAQKRIDEATDVLNESTKKVDSVKETLRDVKDYWGIT